MATFELLQALIPLIAPLLILSACCYYLIRSRQVDSILLTIGATVSLLTTAFVIYIPYFTQTRFLSISDLSPYYTVVGFVSLVGTIAFTVGLFLLIGKVLKLTEKTTQADKFY